MAEADSSQPTDTSDTFTDDPLFGMWRDREEMADVAGYIRSVRGGQDHPVAVDGTVAVKWNRSP
jgi:hypothetical protein